MEEILDLQMFAEGEGGTAAGGDGAEKAPLDTRGAGSRSETEGMGRSFERSVKTQPGGGIPSVTASGGDSSPFAKGEPLGDGSETGDRAAQARDDSRNISSALEKHFRRLEGEAEQMREVFPGFDLRRELRDPRFAALTAPGMGVSVEDAYYALHRRELQAASMQVAAQKTAQKLASSIQSAARRPVENGGGSPTPAGVGLRNLSKEQREELRQRIYTAAALGEKIFP